MENKKLNLVFTSAVIYSLCVYLTLTDEEISRIILYRFLLSMFLVLLLVFNYHQTCTYVSELTKKVGARIISILGQKEEAKKEDKVRTFVE
jgi:hypothetical protein